MLLADGSSNTTAGNSQVLICVRVHTAVNAAATPMEQSVAEHMQTWEDVQTRCTIWNNGHEINVTRPVVLRAVETAKVCSH